MALIDQATGKELWSIQWSQVLEIVAWKDDEFAVDTIYLGFRISDASEYCACSEDQVGWVQLLMALQSRFGVSWTSWWSQVAQPPFARNHTVLWGTPMNLPCGSCGYDLSHSVDRCPECGTPIPAPRYRSGYQPPPSIHR